MKKLLLLILCLFSLITLSACQKKEEYKKISLASYNYSDYLFFAYQINGEYVLVDISPKEETYTFENCEIRFSNVRDNNNPITLSSKGYFKGNLYLLPTWITNKDGSTTTKYPTSIKIFTVTGYVLVPVN